MSFFSLRELSRLEQTSYVCIHFVKGMFGGVYQYVVFFWRSYRSYRSVGCWY